MCGLLTLLKDYPARGGYISLYRQHVNRRDYRRGTDHGNLHNVCCGHLGDGYSTGFLHAGNETVSEATLMHSQIVIPEAILIGDPDRKPLKSWMPDRVIRA
jgi:hypothetical protein